MFNNVFFLLVFSAIALFIYDYWGKRKKAVFFSVLNFLFYILLECRYAILLFISLTITYLLICRGHKTEKKRIKQFWGILGIVYVLLVLCIYKYYSFFTKEMPNALQLTMPIGISYYSFKMISAIADVCLKEEKWDYTFTQYITYISFFPQIMCGPITKIESFVFEDSKTDISRRDWREATHLVVLGLFKKLVIAERLAIYTNTVFADYNEYPAIALWVNALFYSIQIYCDFSGYSDIAIALTRLFGFRCEANFRFPYFSQTVKEFWTRWHISLSRWLRDYIYIPLGGNRKGTWRKQLNTLVVFGISGIWHGNTLNFLVWGVWHAVFCILSPTEIKEKKRLFCRILTFLLVTIGWIFFYYTSVMDAFSYIKCMMTNLNISLNIIIRTILPFTMDYACFAHFGVVLIMIFILFMEECGIEKDKKLNQDMLRVTQAVCIILFGIVGANGFVYANF